MARDRKKTQNYIIEFIDKAMPGTKNAQMYRNIFSVMSDKDFDDLMQGIRQGTRHLYVIEPNWSDNPIDLRRNIEIGKQLGYEFFQRLWVEGQGDSPDYLTPEKALILRLPAKRASQLLIKKISVPKHNKSIDSLTGQPTGESKGAKLSYPELQICAAMQLDNCMVEMAKYNGGDIKGRFAYTAMLSKYGKVNLDALKPYASGVVSTKTLKTFFTCAHLKNNL